MIKSNFDVRFSADKPLTPFVIGAITLHVLIVLLAYLFGIIPSFFSSTMTVAKKKVINEMTIIKTAVRVDVVGMPKFTLKELKSMEAAPALKSDSSIVNKAEDEQEVIKPDDVVIEKKVDLSKLLADLSKKKTETAPKAPVQEKSKFNSEKLKSLVLEGNKISTGTSLTGDVSSEELTLFEKYLGGLPDLIRVHWKLPSYLIDKNLRCRIQIFVGENGQLLKLSIYESSGVSEYDQKAIDAIRASAPFKKPDQKILSKVTSGSVILGFPL
jgi:TonB family protein